MAATLYKQCSMTRGNVRRVEWLPVKYAVVGKALKLRMGDVWEDGWVVETANGESQEKPDVQVAFASLDPRTLSPKRR